LEDEKAVRGQSIISTLMTTAVIVAVLVGTEMSVRSFFEQFQDAHPLLLVETNRFILARHIGVDALMCFTVAFMGFKSRAIMKDMIDAGLRRRPNTMPEAGYETRMFTYHPEAQRILLFFFAYQVKNLYDSWAWEDGAIFIAHHIMAMSAAWGGMHPGVSHFYAGFFMGTSEVSTGVLCLLANFDDEFGVKGLGEAFPVLRAALAGTFTVLFIIFRCIIWPFVAYHFLRDTRSALKGKSEKAEGRRVWMRVIAYTCAGLSVLQVLWLWEIIEIGQKELAILRS